ncbi:phosphatidate cytidylyltransferase [candidate division KSB1 bacterium]
MKKSLLSRIIVSIFGIPLILFLVYKGELYFLLLVSVITLFSLYELLKIGKKYGLDLNPVIGVSAGLIILLEIYFFNFDYLIHILLGILILLLIFSLKSKSENPFKDIAFYLFAFIYVPVFLGCLILIRENPVLDYTVSGKLIIAVLGTIWTLDTAAYFVGSQFGRHKLLERVSPKKTVEGAVGAVFGGFIFVIIAKYTFLTEIEMFKLIIVAAALVVFGQIGDLVESLIKRKAEIKDSSDILFGHGGFLDRFDSLIFTAPVIYIIIKFIF